MNKQFTRLFLAVLSVLWVSGASADNHEAMHHHLPADIDSFHSLLAPVWHARPGKERTRNACAKAAAMEKAANAIQSADASLLATASTAFKSKCEASPADVDAALFDVHEAFHRLIEPKPSASGR